ncbi:EcsC family protein [Metabacillus sp. GX 13764]|uniref:EcsC family protein n=1 Tax=Metabacillus kandeliae TaxID=2900151 RepID=UPI001E3F4747|nr:EcsC family protein [Metabacillus kandeliae]MCD7032774.1 EcsC family protein [Metabacillus kandeliae]
MLNYKEKRLYSELIQWEKHLQSDMRPDLARTYEVWLKESYEKIPGHLRRTFFNRADDIFLHFYSLIQNSQLLHDSGRKIISIAQTYDNSIDAVNGLKKLSVDQKHYIANTQLARHRLYSLVQGGMTGGFGLALYLFDLPLLCVIQIKAIQLTAMSYGYEMNSPYEMMTGLKVYRASLLPKHLRYREWTALIEEAKRNAGTPFLYDSEEPLADEKLIYPAVSQIAKLLFIAAARKKLLQGIPVFGAAAGAGANYRLTKQAADFAQHYYVYRSFLEKGEND